MTPEEIRERLANCSKALEILHGNAATEAEARCYRHAIAVLAREFNDVLPTNMQPRGEQ